MQGECSYTCKAETQEGLAEGSEQLTADVAVNAVFTESDNQRMDLAQTLQQVDRNLQLLEGQGVCPDWRVAQPTLLCYHFVQRSEPMNLREDYFRADTQAALMVSEIALTSAMSSSKRIASTPFHFQIVAQSHETELLLSKIHPPAARKSHEKCAHAEVLC